MPEEASNSAPQTPATDLPKKVSHKNWKYILVGSIFGAVVLVAGAWAVLTLGLVGIDESSSTNNQVTTPVSSTPSAEESTPRSTQDETADWKTFINEKVGFSIKYPQDWLVNSYKKGNCATNNDYDHTFFSPTQGLLGACNSGYGGLISITRVEEGYTIDQYIPKENDTNYKDLKIEEHEAEKRTVKFSGVSTVQNEVVDWEGNKIIEYLIDLGNRTLILSYNQDDKGQDYSKIFEKMFSTFEFLN